MTDKQHDTRQDTQKAGELQGAPDGDNGRRGERANGRQQEQRGRGDGREHTRRHTAAGKHRTHRRHKAGTTHRRKGEEAKKSM